MKRVSVIAGALATLLLAGLLVVANLSVELLVPFDRLGLQYDNTRDARLAAGSLRLKSEQMPQLGVMALAWRYCPGLRPLTWCVQLENPELQLHGTMSLLGGDHILVREAKLVTRSLKPFGLLPDTATARVDLDIEVLQVSQFTCPPRFERAQISGDLRAVNILNGAFGDVQVQASAAEQGPLSLSWDGGFLTGRASLDQAGQYTAEGELKAPPELEGFIRNLARSLGNNRYAWQLSGAFPC